MQNISRERGRADLELKVRIERLRKVLQAGEDCSIVLQVQELKQLLGDTASMESEEVEVQEDVDWTVLERIRKSVTVSTERRGRGVDPLVVKRESIQENELKTNMDFNSNHVLTDSDHEEDKVTASTPIQDFDLVKLCSVESPDSFYIQRVEDWSLLDRLKIEICNITSPPGVGIEVGVVAAFEGKRAKVEVVEGDRVEMVIMDQGERKTVSKQQLIKLSGPSSTLPALAYHCGLSDVNHRRDGWSETNTAQLRLAMLQFAAGTPCRIMLQRMSSKLLVTLVKQQVGDVSGESPASMTEYLQYCGLVKPVSDLSCGVEQRNFIPPSPWRAKEAEKVLVSHVVSPHLLYVNRCGSFAESQMKQQETLNRVYRERWEEDCLRLLVPRVGQACVARYSKDRNVYRARVTEVLGDDMLRVMFVDFGNCEDKQGRELRQLLNQFMCLPELASPVRLADVIPVQKDRWWGAEACSQMRAAVNGKQLSLYVVSVEDELTRVLLYEDLWDRVFSFGGWLVRTGLALTDNGMTGTVEYFKPVFYHFNSVGERQYQSRVNTIAAVCESPITRGILGSDLYKEGLKGNTPVNDLDIKYNMNDAEPDNEKEYKVIDSISPTLIYVRTVEDAEDYFKFSIKLTSFYSSLPATPGLLGESLEGSCLVTKLPKEGWVRVKLVIKGESEVELLIVDHGRKIKVPKDLAVQPIFGGFDKPFFSLIVHLSGQ